MKIVLSRTVSLRSEECRETGNGSEKAVWSFLILGEIDPNSKPVLEPTPGVTW
jgi:hypothetical protein